MSRLTPEELALLLSALETHYAVELAQRQDLEGRPCPALLVHVLDDILARLAALHVKLGNALESQAPLGLGTVH